MDDSSIPLQPKSRGQAFWESVLLVPMVLWKPKEAMLRAVEGRYSLMALVVWLGCYLLPPLYLVLPFQPYGVLPVGTIIGQIALGGLITFGILSLAITSFVRKTEYGGRDVRVILGYSAAPHLLFISLIALTGFDTYEGSRTSVFHLYTIYSTQISALPGGVGLAEAAVSTWDSQIESWFWPYKPVGWRLLWTFRNVPSILTVWSGFLCVVGIGNISPTNKLKITLGYASAVLLLAVCWSAFGNWLIINLFRGLGPLE